MLTNAQILALVTRLADQAGEWCESHGIKILAISLVGTVFGVAEGFAANNPTVQQVGSVVGVLSFGPMWWSLKHVFGNSK